MPTLIEELEKEVAEIKEDIADFDGDKRGMWEALEEAQERLKEEKRRIAK